MSRHVLYANDTLLTRYCCDDCGLVVVSDTLPARWSESWLPQGDAHGQRLVRRDRCADCAARLPRWCPVSIHGHRLPLNAEDTRALAVMGGER